MNITEVKIYKLQDSKTLALASITINNEFVVSGMKVLNGKNGLWVAMPNRKNAQDEYKDICFPITKGARQNIIDLVLGKYNEQVTVQDNVQDDRFTPPTLNGGEHRVGYEKKDESILDVKKDDLPF